MRNDSPKLNSFTYLLRVLLYFLSLRSLTWPNLTDSFSPFFILWHRSEDPICIFFRHKSAKIALSWFLSFWLFHLPNLSYLQWPLPCSQNLSKKYEFRRINFWRIDSLRDFKSVCQWLSFDYVNMNLYCLNRESVWTYWGR